MEKQSLVPSQLQTAGLLSGWSADPPGPAGGHQGGTAGGKYNLKHVLKAFSTKGDLLPALCNAGSLFSANFSPPLICATVTSGGKSVADSQFQPLSKPWSSVPGHCSVSCHPCCPQWFSVRANAPAKQSRRWLVKLASSPWLLVPQKSHAELSNVFCLFACFGKRRKSQCAVLGKRILRPLSGFVASTGKAVPRFLPLSVD